MRKNKRKYSLVMTYIQMGYLSNRDEKIEYPEPCEKHFEIWKNNDFNGRWWDYYEDDLDCEECEKTFATSLMSELGEDNCIICGGYWDPADWGETKAEIGLICDSCFDDIWKKAYWDYKNMTKKEKSKWFKMEKKYKKIPMASYNLSNSLGKFYEEC